VTGEIADISLSGPGNVRVDGTVVRDTTETDAREEDDRRGSKLLVVSSPNTDELLDYTFRVTGDLEELEPDEDSRPAVEEITDLGSEGVRVEGTVGSGDDRFRFTGELVRIDVPPQVNLDVRRE
jgi:outer membrane protein assembly factor BamB